MKPLALPSQLAAPLLPGGSWDVVEAARCGVVSAGIKKPDQPPVRDDVAVLLADGVAAALTTRSSAAAAPCRWTRALVPGPVRAVVVNSGNANASTGLQGEEDTAATAAAVAGVLGCEPERVLVCSTGVIGVPLPMGRLLPAAQEAAARALEGADDGHRLARAILTTDLVPKEAAVDVGGVKVGGVAKGSGMIYPDMATMLAFVTTDARVEPAQLQRLLREVADRTFNAITVDGDTSTNDTLIVQATGTGLVAEPGMAAWEALALGLETVCRKLARDIARDGEGATTLVEVAVSGLADDAEARRAARAVVRSNLLKSAIFGRDPNWGRVVGALGAAGVPHLDTLDLDLAGVPVLRGGRPLAFDERAASQALRAPEVRIEARLPGPGLGFAWGCDLTEGYVKINADYRS